MSLAGVRVLEIAQYVAGPYCAMLLGDMGADVVKVEPPEGDGIRTWAPRMGDRDSGPFVTFNRNKRSVAVDLKHPEGAALVRRLAREADVVIENGRPGAVARYGLDHESLRRDNPALVYVSISGYGQWGPRKDDPAFDLVIQADVGLMSVNGSDPEDPAKVGVPVVDLMGGLHAAVGVLSALVSARESGQGSYLDVSLQGSSMVWMALLASRYFLDGTVPRPLGSAHPLAAPYRAFRCRDGFVALAAGNQGLWERVAEVAGLPHLVQDGRFRTGALRAANQVALGEELDRVFSGRSRADLLAALRAAGVPCAPVNDLAQALADEQVRARGIVTEIPHPEHGTLRTIADPIRATPPMRGAPRPSPTVGEHTREVLAEAGLSEGEVVELIGNGAVRAPGEPCTG